MSHIVSTMTTFSKSFVAAIVKSLLRGKSLIQAILAYWVSPITGRRGSGSSTKTLAEFLKEAETKLLGPVSGDGLQELSAGLKAQFIDRLRTDMLCMLPSYSHQLPFGAETGQFLALDVGGSTLRVAVVELRGRDAEAGKQSEIVSMRNFKIGKDIKDLKGMLFFEWMAERIAETLNAGVDREHSAEKPLPLALAWSFPIEYVMPSFVHDLSSNLCAGKHLLAAANY